MLFLAVYGWMINLINSSALFLDGGIFANGAKTFAFMQMFTEAADYYEKAVGRKANPLPGENREPANYDYDLNGRQYPDTWEQNVIGLNKSLEGAWYSSANFFKQGGMLSRALNLVPTVNATAGLHDYWFNAPQPQGLEFTLVNNVGTMLPAAAISMGASIGNLTQGWQSNPMVLYLLTQPYDRDRR